MKDFFRVLKRFVPPYKKYMALNIVFHILSAILNLFSFALIIPILNILFKMDDKAYAFRPWTWDIGSWDSWKGVFDLIPYIAYDARSYGDHRIKRHIHGQHFQQCHHHQKHAQHN